MISIYQLKPRFQALLRPIARSCATAGVTANMVTITAMLASLALGAVLAVEQAGKADQIKVTGVDGSPEAVEELKREGSPFIGTATQSPGVMVQEAVKIAIEMTKGNLPKEKTVLIPSVLVDRKSVEQYSGW